MAMVKFCRRVPGIYTLPTEHDDAGQLPACAPVSVGIPRAEMPNGANDVCRTGAMPNRPNAEKSLLFSV